MVHRRLTHLPYFGVYWRPPGKVDAMEHEVLDAVVFDGLKQKHSAKHLACAGAQEA
jgi:hypothetical protein